MQGIGKNIPKYHCHHVFVLLWSDTDCNTHHMKDAAWKGLPAALKARPNLEESWTGKLHMECAKQSCRL